MPRLNTLQRALMQRRQKAQRRKDARAERAILESYWQYTGWYHVARILGWMNMKGVAKRLFSTVRVAGMRYVRFERGGPFVAWEVHTICSKVQVLIVEPEHIVKLRELIARNQKDMGFHIVVRPER